MRIFKASQVVALVSCVTLGTPAFSAEAELRTGKHGSYWLFIPSRPAAQKRVVALWHGAVSEGSQATAHAKEMIDGWRSDAERQGVVLVAPVFDEDHYGVVSGPGGGYRSLFGRDVGADQFVDESVAEALGVKLGATPKLLLYGHSAGAQAVLRYAVRHPERVAAVVATSAGSFAFPDKAVPWPDGMKAASGYLPWKGLEPAPFVEVKPNPADWPRAALLPITVIIGAKDTMPLPGLVPGKPTTRIGLAQEWVDEMTALIHAPAKAGVKLVVLEGESHGGPAMRERAAQELFGTTR